MAVQRWTSRRRAAFLKALSDTGNVSAAARAASASRSRAYQLKAADPDFAAEWTDALESAIDALDGEARRRALDGVEVPHFHQGRVAGTVRKYSDIRARPRTDGADPVSALRAGGGTKPVGRGHGRGRDGERSDP